MVTRPGAGPEPHRVALFRAARVGARRAAEGWRASPPAARTGWLAALAGGFLLALAVMAALTALARGRVDEGLQEWDQRVLENIVSGPYLSFHAAMWWEAFGASSILIPVAVTASALAIRARRPLLSATLAASFLLAKPIILVGWTRWDRARPDLVADGIAAPPLHSYPSGHSLQTAAVYGLLFFLWIRASRSWGERAVAVAAWAGLVVIVGLARLRLGVHWPSDVLAGSAAGVAWLVALVVALRVAEARGGR